MDQLYATNHPVERHFATEADFDPDSLTHHQALQCGASCWMASISTEDFDLTDELIAAGKAYSEANVIEDAPYVQTTYK